METAPRTVLVTGASRGIGRAIAERMLADGHEVIGVARSFAAAAAVAAAPEGLRPVGLDLADLDRLPEAFESLLARWPDIDAVVLNAGQGRFGSIEEFSVAQIRALLEIDLISPACVASVVLPRLKRRGTGDLVLIGSEAALAGRRHGAVYCAAKFGLRGLAQALREEAAPAGVRVSIVHPGMVRTGFFDDLSFEPGDADDEAILPGDVAALVAQILATREGTVIDEVTLSPRRKSIRFRGRDGK